VDGGRQRRSFTHIDDGIDALMKILVNKEGCADAGIFNIGNPANDLSIKELAHKLVKAVGTYHGYESVAKKAKIVDVTSAKYYGKGYQDIMTRVPSIKRAKEKLGWSPKVGFDEAIKRTLDFYLKGRQRPAVP